MRHSPRLVSLPGGEAREPPLSSRLGLIESSGGRMPVLRPFACASRGPPERKWTIPSSRNPFTRSEVQRLLPPYISSLELEVDRLRRHTRVLRQEALALVRCT